MSRIAKAPIFVPSDVRMLLEERKLTISGHKNQISTSLHSSVNIAIVENTISMIWNMDDKIATSHAGTARAIISNMIVGVTKGYEKRLLLVGVGYRAQEKDNILNLTLGFSHPIEYIVPVGVTIETPTQTEVVIKGFDKQQVGQVAAKIRSYRPPEPYKGKGIRYSEEHIVKKESKKK